MAQTPSMPPPVPPPPGGPGAPVPPARGTVPSQAERTIKAITTWVRQESAATQTLITAFIALGIAFQWWHWTNAETGAVIGIVTALLGMFVRSQVTPLIRPRTADRRLVPEPDPPRRPGA